MCQNHDVSMKQVDIHSYYNIWKPGYANVMPCIVIIFYKGLSLFLIFYAWFKIIMMLKLTQLLSYLDYKCKVSETSNLRTLLIIKGYILLQHIFIHIILTYVWTHVDVSNHRSIVVADVQYTMWCIGQYAKPAGNCKSMYINVNHYIVLSFKACVNIIINFYEIHKILISV